MRIAIMYQLSYTACICTRIQQYCILSTHYTSRHGYAIAKNIITGNVDYAHNLMNVAVDFRTGTLVK